MWSNSWSGTPTAFTYTYAQASGTAPFEVTLTIDNSLVMGKGEAFEQSAFEQALAQKCAGALSIDVSDAVHRLFRVDIEPRLDSRIFIEGNEFRKR